MTLRDGTRTEPASPWPAPRAHSPISADISLPGSKSMTNRAAVIAALAVGRSTVHRPLRSRDTELMTTGLRALGTQVTAHEASWEITGVAGRPHLVSSSIDVGLAGTVARFLPPVAALAVGAVRFDGDARMRERPMAPLLNALRDLGVEVSSTRGDHLPCTIHGSGSLRGGSVSLDASTSSQLISGLLLAAPCFAEGLTVRHVGSPVPSRPHLDMTVAMMRVAGAAVSQTNPDSWAVSPGGYRAHDIDIEPDLSGAAPFLAAAVATAGTVVVPGWPRTTAQPGEALLELLGRMGARWTLDEAGLVFTGPERVHGIEAELRDCPEMTPVIVALATLADSPSRFTGVAHIRLQETDRIAALAGELSRLGANIDELADGLVVRPAPLRGALLRAHGDHRLAMAWAVVGLVVDDVSIDDIATTGKTMPDFAARWSAMLATAPR